jgi:hypothetical protein
VTAKTENCKKLQAYDRIQQTTTTTTASAITAAATNILIDEYNNLLSFFFFYSIFERKQQTYDTLLSARSCPLPPEGRTSTPKKSLPHSLVKI